MPIPIPAAGSDVLPATDANFGLFGTQFAAAWVPATFNVILPAAATVTADTAAFAAALLIASDPTTRTPVTIATKDAARATAAASMRDAIRAAQAAFLAGTVSEAQINNIGVRANSLIRSPILAPAFAPIIANDGNLTGQSRFRLTQVDPATGIAVTTRKFAYGLVAIEVQRKVGAGEFLLRFSTKRTKFFDVTNDQAMGTVLLYRARYITARGLVSPWSASVQAVAS